MKIKYHRFHKVQPVQYEEIQFGGSITVDLAEDSGDPDYSGSTLVEARNLLNEDMDTLLAIDVKRALASDQLETMHIYEYYEE